VNQPREAEADCAVAVLDILGFRARASSLRPLQVRDLLIGPVLCSALGSKVVHDHDLRWSPNAPKLGGLFFADTLVLALPVRPRTSISTPQRAVASLAFALAQCMSASLLAGIPLRGALAFGTIRACDAPEYLIGNCLLEAHAAETEQDWSGAVLVESAATHMQDECPSIVRWSVPTKPFDGTNRCFKIARSDLLAVNWPAHCPDPEIHVIGQNGACSTRRRSFDWDRVFGTTPRTQRKKTETRSFYDAFVQSGGGGRWMPEHPPFQNQWATIRLSIRRGAPH
jgi:hypothetical protein